MDITSMKARKKELKLTLDEISARSGIPKRTVEDIFRGATKNPRIDTMQAIEEALELNQKPIQWTEEEKALGVVTEYKEKLSPDEVEMLDLYRAVRDEKGEKSAQAIRTLTRTYLEGK